MRNKAKIIFLSKEQGGRHTPPSSGYKPNIKIGEILTSCIVTPVDSSITIMDFGIEYFVFIELQFESLYLDNIYKGIKIHLYEGRKLIGMGEFI